MVLALGATPIFFGVDFVAGVPATFRTSFLDAMEAGAIRWLLGFWVSELEPDLMRDRYGNINGLGYGGTLIVRLSDTFSWQSKH